MKETKINKPTEVDFKMRVNGKLVESFSLQGSSEEEIMKARRELHKIIDRLINTTP